MLEKNPEYQEYPDPMSTSNERMAAANILLAKNSETFNATKDESKVEKPTGMSMPNIYELAKKKLAATIGEGVEHSNILAKILKIYESSAAKEDGLSTLEKLNLPRYGKVKVTAGEFLANPKEYLDLLKTDRYFPSVTNKTSGKRHFKLGLNQKELFSFLREGLNDGKIAKDNLLILSEFHQNFFSGNIIINPPSEINSQASRSISMELVEGVHAGLAYEGSMPIIRTGETWYERPEIEVLLTEDLSPYLLEELSKVHVGSYISFKVFKEIVEGSEFSTEEDKKKLAYYQFLVEKLISILNLIPKIEDDTCHFSVDDRSFFPGYYEFILGDTREKDRPKKDKIKAWIKSIERKLFGGKAIDYDELLKSIGSMKVYFLDYRKADHYSNLQHNFLEESDGAFA